MGFASTQQVYVGTLGQDYLIQFYYLAREVVEFPLGLHGQLKVLNVSYLGWDGDSLPVFGPYQSIVLEGIFGGLEYTRIQEIATTDDSCSSLNA